MTISRSTSPRRRSARPRAARSIPTPRRRAASTTGISSPPRRYAPRPEGQKAAPGAIGEAGRDPIRLVGIPATLCDLVRRNRDRLEVGLATAAEVAAVTGEVDASGMARGQIDDWHVVALRDRVADRVSLHMLGTHESGQAWITSDVRRRRARARPQARGNAEFAPPAGAGGRPAAAPASRAARRLRAALLGLRAPLRSRHRGCLLSRGSDPEERRGR